MADALPSIMSSSGSNWRKKPKKSIASQTSDYSKSKYIIPLLGVRLTIQKSFSVTELQNVHTGQLTLNFLSNMKN